MPLIKYYSFSEFSRTCYDGQREFTLSQGSQRFYPDEYLIANILNNYLSSQSSRINTSSKKIIVLTEQWSGNGGTRDGGKNTLSFNEQIFEAIKKAESDSEVENTLILVPFLYGYHHPGVAIDVNNNMIVYLDPFGYSASKYRETSQLQHIAETVNFDFQYVSAEQQQRGQDGTSCGPILTISMIMFIEEFLKNGRITKEGFEAPRRNLATDRLFQMYVNNTQEIKEEKSALDEIMLADKTLWQSVFSEQQLKVIPESEILSIVAAQRVYVESLKGIDIDPFNLKKIQSICNFQSRLTELIFLNPPDLQFKITILLNEGRKALVAKETDEHDLILSTLPVNLLQSPNLNSVHKNLRLEKCSVAPQQRKDFDEEKASRPAVISQTKNRNRDGIRDFARRNKKSIIALCGIILIGVVLLLNPLGLVGASAAGLALLITACVGMGIASMIIARRTACQHMQAIDQSQSEQDKPTKKSADAKVTSQVRETVAQEARPVDYLAQAKSSAHRRFCCFSNSAECNDAPAVSGNRSTYARRNRSF